MEVPKMARPWWDPKRPAGFRLSVTDGVVILLCAAGTWLLWRWLDVAALILPVVMAHFFLFCNVFRVGRRPELTWAAILVANAVVWLWLDAFSILRVVLAQTPVTVAVIFSAVLGKEYRGIGSRMLKEKQ